MTSNDEEPAVLAAFDDIIPEVDEDTTILADEHEVDLEYVWTKEDSNLYRHAMFELHQEGLLAPGSDYDGMLGRAVLELIETFAKQGHSGFSAGMTVELFKRLASFEPLGDITDDPEVWAEVHEGIAGEPDGLWQCRRKSSCFSHDGGKTFYDIDLPASPDGSPMIFISKEATKHA